MTKYKKSTEKSKLLQNIHKAELGIKAVQGIDHEKVKKQIFIKNPSRPITPSEFCKNIYKYLDAVALNGKTIEIKYKGYIIKLKRSDKRIKTG